MRLKKFYEYSTNDTYIKLVDIMEYPDQDELIWNFIGQSDFENEKFPIKVINPVEWFNSNVVGDITIKEAYLKHSEPWQKKLVKKYQKNIEDVKNTYLVISDDILVDGFHRIVSLALSGITSANAVDIS